MSRQQSGIREFAEAGGNPGETRKTRAAWPLAKRARVAPSSMRRSGGGVAWPALVELPCGGSVPVWCRQLHSSGGSAL